MDIRYDIDKIKEDLQDEYMAASLVGFTEDTPDLMDIEYSNARELLSMAEHYGLKLEDYIIPNEDETDK
ncbi:MAG: hypothetical protein MR011_04835 [Lachnospiraceae bacterium]|nr:hypothetical protein [Lachnospiraceae bacterium]